MPRILFKQDLINASYQMAIDKEVNSGESKSKEKEDEGKAA